MELINQGTNFCIAKSYSASNLFFENFLHLIFFSKVLHEHMNSIEIFDVWKPWKIWFVMKLWTLISFFFGIYYWLYYIIFSMKLYQVSFINNVDMSILLNNKYISPFVKWSIKGEVGQKCPKTVHMDNGWPHSF